MNTSDIMVTIQNNESNIKEQIIQSQEQEKTNPDFIKTINKSLLFDKLMDIKQKADDLMEEIDRAIQYLAHIVILTDEQQFGLGNFSYDTYVNALRFAKQVSTILKEGDK